MAGVKEITQVLSAEDAWGKVHRFEVTWRPVEVTGFDGGLANLGVHSFAFEDEPPVSVELGHDGFVKVSPVVRKFDGSTAETVGYTITDDLERYRETPELMALVVPVV